MHVCVMNEVRKRKGNFFFFFFNVHIDLTCTYLRGEVVGNVCGGVDWDTYIS